MNVQGSIETIALFCIVVHLVLAAIFSAVPRAAGRGGVKKNSWVGVRTPSTMQSDAAWAAGHRASALPLGLAATTHVGGLVATVLAWAVGNNKPVIVVVMLVCAVLDALFVCWAVVRANAAAKVAA